MGYKRLLTTEDVRFVKGEVESLARVVGLNSLTGEESAFLKNVIRQISEDLDEVKVDGMVRAIEIARKLVWEKGEAAVRLTVDLMFLKACLSGKRAK